MLWAALPTHAKEVRVGIYSNEPKVFLDPAGQPAGIFVDLLQGMAQIEGWTLAFVPCTWQDCLKALEADQIDLMPDVAYTADRDRIFDFHQVPALLSWSQIYRSPDAQITTLFDLSGKRVAVLEGSIQSGIFTEMMTSFGVKPELVPVATLDEAFKLVAEGRADAAIANYFYGNAHAARYQLVETAIVFQPSRLFYATALGRNQDLLRAIDRHLESWQGDPKSLYFTAMKRWVGAVPQQVVPDVFWWSLMTVGGLLSLSMLAALLLRRQVSARTQHLLAANEEIGRFKTIFDHATFAAWIAELGGTLTYVNARCAELHGMRVEDLLGKRFTVFYAEDQRAEARTFWKTVQKSGSGEVHELWHVARDGRRFPMLTSGTLLRDGKGVTPSLLACTAVDISERKQAEAQIKQLAYYDALTGLPNRRLLMERLQHALDTGARRDARGAVLFIDLDHFKTLNDTLGHDVGDQLLQEVARRIQTHVRVGDTVARLGGDEFVVLIEDLSDSARPPVAVVEGVGQKIMAALNQPYRLAGVEHHSTPSIGATLFNYGEGSVDEPLKQADLAMYQAKAAGRNTMRFFDPAMQTEVAIRAEMEKDLRTALQEQQFLIYIQPQVNRQGDVFGAEVLLRWPHPQRGMVSPGEFIPVAEDSGLIVPLGQWVLEAACLQLLSWAGRPSMSHLTLAVNVSVQQFRHPDFVAQVQAVIDRTGVDPSRLKLEITESLLMLNVEDIIGKMTALKAGGVSFSLDDFGTGYSSLSYLRRLPLDQLKIDQSFVRNVFTDPNDAAIVRAIITLAQSLSLMVVAEGVETEVQQTFLNTHGCNAYQGYLFGRPMPPSEFDRYMLQQLPLE
jgi:diguanylate cyclase (GGDEF)-like protein/PAS domain S-box-containing protein